MNISTIGFFCGLVATQGLVSCSAAPGLAASDHFDGSVYFNEAGTPTRGFSDVLKWKMEFAAKSWPDWVENKFRDGPSSQVAAREISMTFINHSSFLIQTATHNFLTDPVFSERVSPFTWIGPKRVREPGLVIDELPRIDFIVISHNHYDHMDMASLKRIALRDGSALLVPIGDKDRLTKEGVGNVFEYDWWQTHEVSPELAFTFARNRHFSGRWIDDRNRALWGSWIIRLPFAKIYFAGDTGYADHFSTAVEKYGGFDLSLLPIGAYEPRWFMKEVHMNPAEAVQAHKDLKSRVSVGMHFGAFQLTDEGIDEPENELAAALAGEEAPLDFQVMEVGQTRAFKF